MSEPIRLEHTPQDSAATRPTRSNEITMGGRLMGQTKSGPAGVDAPVIPGLTANKERLMTQRINPQSDHKATCLVFLELAADDLAKAKQSRERYAKLARKYGLTNAEIGGALGMTEARVRQIVAGGA